MATFLRAIDCAKLEKDAAWDGLKGDITNREEKRFTLSGMSDEQQLLYGIFFGKLSIG